MIWRGSRPSASITQTAGTAEDNPPASVRLAQPIEQPESVGQHAHQCLRSSRISPNIMIKNPSRASIWTQQTGSHGQGGGLAGSVRPDQPEHAAAPHLKIEMINCPLDSERLAEPYEGERRSHAAARPSNCRSARSLRRAPVDAAAAPSADCCRLCVTELSQTQHENGRRCERRAAASWVQWPRLLPRGGGGRPRPSLVVA